ncbi:hydrolase [Sphingobacteriaceae bacterium]|nr:hydrolase [Sphingobacteriaceae bacterium]
MRKKLKITVYSFLGLFVLCFLLIFYIFRPSANLEEYSEFRIKNQSTKTSEKGQLKITYLGVATLLMDDGETQILSDGFVSRPSLLKVGFGKIGSDTTLVKSVIADLRINRLKGIFTAHSHYDHAMDAPYFAKYTEALLYGSESTLNIGRGAGLSEDKLKLFEPGTVQQLGNFRITVLKSKHTPPLTFPKEDDTGKSIHGPLKQPASRKDFVEGGAYDLLIEHGSHKLYVKASTNFSEHALDSVRADILFLGVATLSKQDSTFQNDYYKNTVETLKPKILIPIHWDNFFKPLSEGLIPYPKLADDVKKDFDFLIGKTRGDGTAFRIMMAYDSFIIF